MKFYEVIPALLEGKKIYNSEFNNLVEIGEKTYPNKEGVYRYLSDAFGVRFEFDLADFESDKWNILTD
jgi:hypothetical protein